jgi:drug/metabolite transporter (DMT)-like permease
VTPLVVTAVLLAAITHASWNAIAHELKNELLGLTLLGLCRTLCGLALAVAVAPPAGPSWPYLLASGAIHVVYQLLLIWSYRVGDFGQTYPIARGTAPIVVTVLAAVLVGELPHGRQALGVLVMCGGLAGIALWGIRGADVRPTGTTILAAAATGLAIAAYTVVDGVGVRASGSSLGYIAWLVVLDGLAIPVYAVLFRRHALRGSVRPLLTRAATGGSLSVVAYGLVLWAQTRAPLAPVAVLRESSIIAGAAIGALFFKEQFGRPRVIATIFVVTGLALMLAGG